MEAVCVTGASGFVASWLVKRLLDKGYKVRGTVRDAGEGALSLPLSAVLFGWNERKLNRNNHRKRGENRSFAGASGSCRRLELFKADLSEEGSFAEAIKGCNGVFHVASPVSFHETDDPEERGAVKICSTGFQGEYVRPAVEGTLDVLKTCLKEPSVKRVVYTSSISAIRSKKSLPRDRLLDEGDWSDVEFCRENLRWYALSKTLAEQAVWDFVSKNQLDLVSVIPSLVLGGPCLPVPLTASLSHFLRLLKGDVDFFNEYYSRMSIVHVDDVATAHIMAYEVPSASGRYICSAQDFSCAEAAALLAERYPQILERLELSKFVEPNFRGWDSAKIVNLGLKFKSEEVCGT